MDLPNPAFEWINADAGGPVLLSVPHAGRTYGAAHRAAMRPPAEKLVALEDRLVDEVARGQSAAPALIAHAPRAWIDLNRNEKEIDPGLVEGAAASRVMLTPKVRSGLGLVPRRLGGVGELWRGKLDIGDVEARIAAVHRPYHAALAQALAAVRDQCGIAFLIDLHSMPPLPRQPSDLSVRVVIGNRYGRSAAPWLTARIADACARFGLGWRENSPYAGGHVVERHGAPAHGIHAVQLEIDRSLYLDPAHDRCDPHGLARVRAFLGDLIAVLQAGTPETAWPLAAE